MRLDRVEGLYRELVGPNHYRGLQELERSNTMRNTVTACPTGATWRLLMAWIEERATVTLNVGG